MCGNTNNNNLFNMSISVRERAYVQLIVPILAYFYFQLYFEYGMRLNEQCRLFVAIVIIY